MSDAGVPNQPGSATVLLGWTFAIVTTVAIFVGTLMLKPKKD